MGKRIRGIPFQKRMTDVLLSFILLVILSPLFLIIGFLLLIIAGRPILFRQERPGYKGEIFEIIKFRTMKDLVDENGLLLADEHRLSKFGKFLRKSSLDELPEIINIIRGEMSIVGPRPLLTVYLDRYSSEQARRHDVLPGITGWAQINGRNAISWEKKFEYDVWYVDNWSYFLDWKIMFISLWKVIKKEGISQPGRATMDEFMGSSDSDS